jgi:hypothetical protein
MSAVERRFKKHEGVQIWKVIDGQDVSYKSDPIEEVIFECGTIREVQALISICNLFGCVKSPVSSK